MHWECRGCRGIGYVLIKNTDAEWWAFWHWLTKLQCDACGGDGHAKPTGWPDEAEMKRFRPKPPKSPPPPPPKPNYELSELDLLPDDVLIGRLLQNARIVKESASNCSREQLERAVRTMCDGLELLAAKLKEKSG